MQFDASLLVMMGIFWVCYIILRVFFFKPMLALLEERESRIEGAQEIYDEAVAKTTEQIEAEKARLAETRREALAGRDEQRRRANDQRLEALAVVKGQVQERLAEAGVELDGQVAAERSTLEERARALADEMTRTLMGRPA
ncbi:MAG: hypothetical protein VYE73_05670 [Acidobacteriota bacterium]|nr:hypothetical protein [Acidobacteriota bacterium]